VVWVILATLAEEDLDFWAKDDEEDFTATLPAGCLPFKGLSFLLADSEEVMVVGIDKHVSTLCIYFRNFIRIFWYF
jgi:hypothetical protein